MTDPTGTNLDATTPPQDPGYIPSLPLAELRNTADRLRAEVQKVIVGQEKVLDLLLIALLSDGHVLIEGMPGLAKTLTAKLLARTVDTGFSRIQFTPDLMPSDVIGTSVFDPRTSTFEFKSGPIFSNIILIDEINRAPAKTQAALFEAMEERQVTVDGRSYPLGAPFLVVATQNPIEHEGTYRLPEAQLDRFLFKVEIGYPGVDDEVALLQRSQEGADRMSTAHIRPTISPAELRHARTLAAGVRCDEKLVRYIAEIIHATRNDRTLMLGASPRASLATLRASKSAAAIQGRDFVVPEDIQLVLPPVLRHRILLTPEREMEGLRPDEVVAQFIAKVPVPR
ncbi:MAG: MoxR family ATPase [Bacteroidetes bacterium]|nr:MoxR family ATPase [Bacteroidota bacterium]HMU15675.1 MoxR family ATPase [Flavobacteriales bacterium]